MRRSVNPRSCVACKRERPPREMLRVVRKPDGQVVVDSQGHESGRGAYLCPESQCVALALKKKLLEKSLKCAIPTEVQNLLRERVQLTEMPEVESDVGNDELRSALGLARKAGELIVGQDRVLECLASRRDCLVLMSNDYSETLKRNVDAKGVPVHILADLSRLELGQLLGLRQAQIVALPAQSGFARKLVELLPEGGNALE